MSRYPAASFLVSADRPSGFPADTGAEVAFAGRSNAGKSSAINAIVQRRRLARTSKTPGRTQLINFFALGEGARLVDLPGYGYARVPQAQKARWGALLQQYFERRQSLAGLFLIVDCRRGIAEYDGQMLALAGAVGVPVHVLLAKADKLKRGRAAEALRDARRHAGDATVQLFSATAGSGLEEARDVLDAFLRGTGKKNPRRHEGIGGQ